MTRYRMGAESYLLMPIDMIEPRFDNSVEAMGAVMTWGSKLSESSDARSRFQWWVSGLKGKPGHMIYGSILSFPSTARDIDVMSVSPLSGLGNVPGFVHMSPGLAGRVDEAGYEPFFAGSLLFPSEPTDQMLASIESARVRMDANPFFGGGIGDLLLFSAFKAIGKERAKNPRAFGSVDTRISYLRLDPSTMENKPSKPEEMTRQRLSELTHLEERELKDLAAMAIRRLAIKEGRRAALCDRFVGAIRAAKC